MADAAALTAVINKAVEIGADLIVDSGTRLYRLKEDIGWLERKMRHFKSCLRDAESKEAENDEVANLIVDMRDLALDMDDILDTYLPQIASHKGKGPFRFVRHAACMLCYGATANTFSLKIGGLKQRAEEIEATRERCKISTDANDGGHADAETWNRRRKFLVSNDSIIVGREETLQKLKAELLSEILECKTISVVGEAGVGKTVIAKKLYREVKEKFDCSCLVYISNEPRVRDILLEIANQVGLGKEEMNENLEANLLSLLEEKRFLIFLDDIWKCDTWDDLKHIIPANSRNGSRVIITSRYTNVARYIGGDCSITGLNLLKGPMGWELFYELMRSSFDSSNTNEGIERAGLVDIGRKIVKKCGGLPLAIEVAVGMLRQRRRNKHEWNEVLDRMSRSAENCCSKILALSYKDLPLDLRSLFLYFGIFPEDSEIFVSDLSRAWVVEKLIHVNATQNLEDVVAAKIETLVDRNLIKVSRRGFNDMIKSCRIHDLIRSLCIDVAKENNFFFTLENTSPDSVSRLRRLAIDTSNFSPSFRAPKLRTLLWFGKDDSSGWCPIPNEIGNFSSLTCVTLNGHFRRIPLSIGNLGKLVTLDFQKAYFDSELPRSILKKKWLKHLLLNRYLQFHSKPIRCTNWGVENEVHLPNIETLDWLSASALKPNSLRELSNLAKLNLFDVTRQHIQVISNSVAPISNKLQDLRLNIDLQQLDNLNLSPYHNLVKLRLEHAQPMKLGCITFPRNLVNLTLEYMDFQDDPMKVLKKLPRLEILRFKECGSHSSVERMDCSGENNFLQLQILAIIGGRGTFELTMDQGGMPKLCKFVCTRDDLIIPERLVDILVTETTTVDEEDPRPERLAWIRWHKIRRKYTERLNEVKPKRRFTAREIDFWDGVRNIGSRKWESN